MESHTPLAQKKGESEMKNNYCVYGENFLSDRSGSVSFCIENLSFSRAKEVAHEETINAIKDIKKYGFIDEDIIFLAEDCENGETDDIYTYIPNCLVAFYKLEEQIPNNAIVEKTKDYYILSYEPNFIPSFDDR